MKDTDVFEGKKLSDLLQDIHNTTVAKRSDIQGVIQMLTSMVKTPDDAVMLIPLIKDFYEVGVKNDDQIVKVATVVQRLISADSYKNGDGEGVILSEAEKERLLANALEDINAHVAEVDDALAEVKIRADGI